MAGQTAYNNIPDIAVPGMLADENLDSKVLSFVAAETIYPGRLCQVDSAGGLHLVNGASNVIAGNDGNSAACQLAGVSILDVAREQLLAAASGSAGNAYYQSGEMVPVMRKGRVFAAWDNSGTQGIFKTPLVWHPSTTDTNLLRGVFSNTATSSVVAGSEVIACPAEILEVKDCASLTPSRGAGSPVTVGPVTWVCKLEINLPGA